MTDDEKRLQAQLAPLGLPDDLVEIALKDAPALAPEALARIRKRTLDRAAGGDRVPVQRKPRRLAVWAAAAALALVAVGTTAVVGPDQVWARFMQYVPGFGTRDAGEATLAAERPVRVEEGGKWVEVRGLMAGEQGISVRVATHGVPLSLANVLLEAGGTQVPMTSGHYSTGGGQDYEGWLWTPENNLSTDLRSVAVLVRDGTREWRIPLALVPGSQLVAIEQFGPSATVSRYRLAARLTAYENRTALTVLTGAPAGEMVIELGRNFPDMAADRPLTLSAPGWEREPGSRGDTLDETWEFETDSLPAGAESVRLTVPAVEVRQTGQAKVRLPVATGDVNQTVQVGDWPVTITRTEDLGGGSLKLWFDLGPAGTRYLTGLGLVKQGGREVSRSWKVDEVHGQMEWMVIDLKPGAKSVMLTLGEPHIVVEGPWVIDLPVSQ